MTLTDIEKKCLMLAMDSAATEFEMAIAATKFIRALKSRYPSGVELIRDMELGGTVHSVRPPQPYTQPRPQPEYDGGWGDILRKAQQFGRAHAARQQQYHADDQQQTWEEFKRRMREGGIV